MKKLVILFALIIAGFVIYPVINSYYLQSQIREFLKEMDISTFNQQNDDRDAKVIMSAENRYPQFIYQVNYIRHDNFQIPSYIFDDLKASMDVKSCDILSKKWLYMNKAKRQAFVKVLREDQVNMVFIVLDKNQRELLRHERKFIDCPNIQASEK